ncbi:MAG: hypothetical protein KatS3mg055_3230 [Chloroflexus sp.]|jgi:hypothetical protein|uniref:T4 family baseplate hub assembly chaperone n=1 Tax=Chloroflexus sp. TaxID=1904827 RepID=UPI0021DCB368|nr:hypothetical protein [Chloroflexus sp.]GIV90712.1 MAG: hypothetical protein KatS3mg055_3230 [Chloroflexus sp.]
MAISAATLLNIWETGTTQAPVVRVLTLLTPLFPETPVAELPIGMRDSLLLLVREWLLGTQMDCVAVCPGCATRVEFVVATTALRALAPTITEQQLTIGEQQLAFRLPASIDLLALPRDSAATRHLIERCLIEAPMTLSDEILTAVATAMTEADPLLDLRIALNCPDCGHTWVAPFDVAGFVWQELDRWVRRLLRDVHSLARAYGWEESAILALSPQRRALYLQMVNDERSVG